MERIASFSVNHLLLDPGIYVSRIDRDPASGMAVTTFDLRLTAPNDEPVMNTAECHTIEHLGATFLRNHAEWAPLVVYFGPMGCRTGFYLVVFGEVSSEEILPLVREMFEFVRDFEGEIPRLRGYEQLRSRRRTCAAPARGYRGAAAHAALRTTAVPDPGVSRDDRPSQVGEAPHVRQL